MGRGGQGRPTKPTALKVIHGDRKDRVNTAEPLPTEAAIVPPDWLTSAAVSEWDRLAPDLIGKRVLTSWDVQSFAEWCDAVATIAEAAEHLAVEGHVCEQEVFDRNGKPTGHRLVKNPWAQVQKDALEVSARRAAQFGMTPAARASISVGSPTADGVSPERLLS